mmetsp:Transcript_135374/g.350834  ORF Transcript_135374/g.350834 Transcript_135374/m.350834 type:complete len:380 (+) Transcript_135374:385-1524(+)
MMAADGPEEVARETMVSVLERIGRMREMIARVMSAVQEPTVDRMRVATVATAANLIIVVVPVDLGRIVGGDIVAVDMMIMISWYHPNPGEVGISAVSMVTGDRAVVMTSLLLMTEARRSLEPKKLKAAVCVMPKTITESPIEQKAVGGRRKPGSRETWRTLGKAMLKASAVPAALQALLHHPSIAPAPGAAIRQGKSGLSNWPTSLMPRVRTGGWRTDVGLRIMRLHKVTESLMTGGTGSMRMGMSSFRREMGWIMQRVCRNDAEGERDIMSTGNPSDVGEGGMEATTKTSGAQSSMLARMRQPHLLGAYKRNRAHRNARVTKLVREWSRLGSHKIGMTAERIQLLARTRTTRATFKNIGKAAILSSWCRPLAGAGVTS